MNRRASFATTQTPWARYPTPWARYPTPWARCPTPWARCPTHPARYPTPRDRDPKRWARWPTTLGIGCRRVRNVARRVRLADGRARLAARRLWLASQRVRHAARRVRPVARGVPVADAVLRRRRERPRSTKDGPFPRAKRPVERGWSAAGPDLRLVFVDRVLERRQELLQRVQPLRRRVLGGLRYALSLRLHRRSLLELVPAIFGLSIPARCTFTRASSRSVCRWAMVLSSSVFRFCGFVMSNLRCGDEQWCAAPRHHANLSPRRFIHPWLTLPSRASRREARSDRSSDASGGGDAARNDASTTRFARPTPAAPANSLGRRPRSRSRGTAPAPASARRRRPDRTRSP